MTQKIETTDYIGWTCRTCGKPVAGPYAACICGDQPSRVKEPKKKQIEENKK